MNILFLTMNNFADISEHGIYPDLIRKFAKEKHHITVLLPNEKRNNQKTFCEIDGNIKIIRVQTGNLFNVGLFTKLKSRAGLCPKFLHAVKRFCQGEKYDLVLYSTPPTTFHRIVKYIKDRDAAYAYLMLKDIFPQNAVDLGIIAQNGPVFHFFRGVEKKLYRISDTIGCMSPANKEFLQKQDSWIGEKKIEICPNALEIRDFEMVNKDEVRKKYNIPLTKTVFVYGGGLGKAQGIDFLISCFEKASKLDDAYFVICGDGPYYDELKEQENRYSGFVKVIKWLPVEDYYQVVRASDVGMIFLNDSFKIPNFPSRLLLYMEAALPVIACTDISTDIGKIAENNRFGNWIESKEGNEELFVELMKKYLIETVRKEMSLNSRKYFEKEYSVDKVYATIVRHLTTFEKTR